MLLQLNKNLLHTSIDIDPISKKEDRVFHSRISVVVHHMGSHVKETPPIVIHRFSGRLTYDESGMIGEGFILASFICRHADRFGGLEGIYSNLKYLRQIHTLVPSERSNKMGNTPVLTH